MAKIKDYYKIVPNSRLGGAGLYQLRKSVTNASTQQDGYAVGTASTQYLKNTLKFTGNRFQKYSLYDQMDSDVDVSKALNTITDEMTPINTDTNLPFDIHYNNDIDEEVDESMVVTIRSALYRWSTVYNLDNRLWAIIRYIIKYGDCFFIKHKIDGELHTKWKFVDIRDIMGIAVDMTSNEVKYYQLKTTSKSLSPEHKKQISMNQKGILIKRSEMVHFSLFDETKDTHPFGESVLSTLYRTFKQLEMLEDSLIIYRVVRAPERRVFYVDVGKMSPAKSKKYLEKVKNDIRQRKIPIKRAGQNTLDSTYDPESMVEDFFLAQPSDGRGSKIETLSGGQNLGEMDDLFYFQDKLFRGLNIPVSYMVNGNDREGATVSDGRVGTAYIQELRFVRYIMRLQELIDGVFDVEFKQFLVDERINIEESDFTLKFNPPQNFAVYRELELAGDLLNTFASASDIHFMSERHALMKYMNWSEEDIQLNEVLLKQERGISGDITVDVIDPDTDEVTGTKVITELQQLYDPRYNGSE